MTSTAWANTLKRATPATPVIVLPTEHAVAQTPAIVNESMPAITPAITTSTNTPIALLEVQADTTQPPKEQEQALPPTYRPQTRILIPTQKSSHLIDPTKNVGNQSLAGLNQFYQYNPTKTQGRTCQGIWQYPYPIITDDNLVATANYGYYNAKDYAELSGNVIVTQNGRQIRANKLHLNPNTGEAQATGQVLFGSSDTANNDLMGIAQNLRYNTQTGAMMAHDVAFASKSLSAHVHAQSLSTPTPQSHLMEQALFSTCPPDDRVWHIRAKHIHLDKDTGRGIAKNTTLAIKDVPVFYLPYFNFPIDDRRHSGFLLPRIGINSTDGLQLATPYYFNLAPNYDTTITPTFYTNRNPKLSSEFRYLTHFGQGKIDTAFLPKDQEYNRQNRSHLFFEHDWRPFIDKDFDLFARYRYVSDNRYLSDFDTLGLASNANLPSVIGASYQTPRFTAHLKAETFQRLKGTDRQGNPIADKDRPYNRLPQLVFTYQLPNITPYADVHWINNSAYFKKSIKDGSDSEKSGVRIYNELIANRTFAKSWGYFSPKVALAHLFTSYDEASLNEHNLSKKEGSHSVLLPKVSLDGALYLEKQGSLFGNTGGRQILSPRLKYLYTPYKDQSQMPNFETTLASPSYDQLLADSWFLGYDRIGDLHAITPALSYRYMDTMGNTRFDFTLADQFYLDPIQVGLESTINTKPTHSGLSWQMGIRPSSKLWLASTGSLDDQHRLSTVAGSLNYQPSTDRLFGFGMVKRKENQAFGQLPLHAYTASAILPINERLRLATTTQYDLSHRQFMDTLVGISYEDCCVSVTIYGRQHKNELSPNDKYHRSIIAEIRLNGITGQGRLARLLDEKVAGFEKLTW